MHLSLDYTATSLDHSSRLKMMKMTSCHTSRYALAHLHEHTHTHTHIFWTTGVLNSKRSWLTPHMVGKIAFLHESCRVMEDAWNYTVKSLFHATNHGMTQDVYIYLHVDCERLIRAMWPSFYNTMLHRIFFVRWFVCFLFSSSIYIACPMTPPNVTAAIFWSYCRRWSITSETPPAEKWSRLRALHCTTKESSSELLTLHALCQVLMYTVYI